MSHNSFGESSTRLTHEEPAALTAELRDGMFAVDTAPDGPPEGDTWSSWDGAQHGPNPRPDWVITDLGAVDEDLGIIKSGKEADVHVVRRWVPGGRATDTDNAADTAVTADTAGGGSLMAAKRFRDSDHRMFHRDAGYLEGRRVRRSREMRAMARRTDFGKQMISSQWAFAEFNALNELWSAGLPVPYPVQISGTEVLMEFIGDGVQAALRLAQTRPEPALVGDLFDQCRVAMSELALRGWAHGDLSPYNVLLHHDRLVFIDWPQIVDIIGNPRGPEFLQRDCHNMCAWFVSRGLAVDEEDLFGDLMAAAASHW
ncbi:MAG TPA: RIO1 family regulatory kinase/ATPase [Dermatophilaceae bacterium]|nr:RIO1 family regulatory kinase/ATPase [Dermatophilaceae bacterium]